MTPEEQLAELQRQLAELQALPDAEPPVKGFNSTTFDPFTAAKIGVPLDPATNIGSEENFKQAGTLGLETAGAMLLPELTVAKMAGKSLPYLGRLANYGKTALASAVGLEGGQVIAEQAGLKPQESFGQHALDTAINSTLGFAIPGAVDTYGSLKENVPTVAKNLKTLYQNQVGVRPSDIENLSNPANKVALEYAQRNNPNLLGQDISQPFRMGENTRSVINTVQQYANNPNAIGLELGMAGGDTAVAKALTQNFQAKGHKAVSLGVFDDVPDVPSAIKKAESLSTKVLEEKASILARLDDAPGMIIKDADLQPVVQQLDNTIQELNLNQHTIPFAEKLAAEKARILYDIRVKQGFSPSQAAQYQENLNFFRREILKEFDARGASFGPGQNIPVEAAAEKAALESIQQLQRGLNEALEAKVASVAQEGYLPVELVGKLPELNAQYGGLQATEELLHQTAYGTLKGLSQRDPTRIVQNVGQQNLVTAFASNAGPSKSGIARGVYETGKEVLTGATDSLTPEAARYAMNVNRDNRIIQNIQSIRSLQKNPINLIPDTPKADLQQFSGPSPGREAFLSRLPQLPALMSIMGGEEATASAEELNMLQTITGQSSGMAPAPIPRNSSSVMADPNLMWNVGNIAATMGLIKSPEDFYTMPESQIEQVIGMVSGAMPGVFSRNPDNVNVINGRYQDPFGKDAVITQALNAPAEERAMRIGGTYANKYIPSKPTPTPQPPKALPLTMEKLNRGLGSVWEARQEPQMDTSYDGSLQRQLEQLTEMKALHESDIQ